MKLKTRWAVAMVTKGDQMIKEALDDINFRMELVALQQIEIDLIEAEIADIGALQNQLEAIKC